MYTPAMRYRGSSDLRFIEEVELGDFSLAQDLIHTILPESAELGEVTGLNVLDYIKKLRIGRA